MDAAMSDSVTEGLVTALARRISASLLPGEEPLRGAALTAAAHFVLSAMMHRSPGTPAVAIDTVTGSKGERVMRLAAINDDMPFLVDSVAACLAAQGLSINRLVHPVTPVQRDHAGQLLALPGKDGPRESIIYIETGRADARTRRAIETQLAATLADVKAAVGDWPDMQAAMAQDAAALGMSESAALLSWFKGGMLTQLGHVRRLRDGSQQDALGICRLAGKTLLAPASYDRAFAWFDTERDRPLLIVKSNLIARVHRRVPLDLFIVPVRDTAGEVVALSVHAGVWTSAALATPPHEVPLLRRRLTEIMTRFGFDPHAHAGKALVHALTALPHDLLIGFSLEDLERIATAMMSVVDRPRPRLALVRAPLDRHIFTFVWLPRDVMSTTLRLRIERLLIEATGARLLDWSLEIEGSNLALLRFVLDIRDGDSGASEVQLDQALQTMVRGWTEAVEAELVHGDDTGRAAVLASRFADAFPPAYRDTYGAAEAARDILRLRRLGKDSPRAARLYRLDSDSVHSLRLKLYQPGGGFTLSDTVPVLENFGLRVIETVPTALSGGALGAIHDFLLELPQGISPDALLARAEVIEAAVTAVLDGTADNDAFNRLIVASGLSAREADWLRAWYRYLRQSVLSFGIPTVVDALTAAPQVVRGIVDLFLARHDPVFAGNRQTAEDAANEAIREGLGGVAAINDDRLLRAYRALVLAIVRTNAFAPAGHEALAFKIASAEIPGQPRPVPWREIFVYSRRVEGIHLRAGPIARGGLRWSDRRDDFRTEVLGLMKAQRVKNAVIVPTGAKGGFYPKQLPDPRIDRDAWAAEGRAAYQLFIRTLLSLTDNIVGGTVVHPAGVVVRDGDDPYFVVAADKGTATFSDTANAIAEDRDFWLDDAFASGGSKGYDHKAMGITAKGAWLSVRRHFLEQGVDVQTEPVRVAGCGDMSGDVFGNGMLLSQAIKLVAAFDHRHIFLDPDPDPAKSWAERARMFALPRSSWDDYDRTAMSKGGGIFARSLKEIPLSAEIQAVLGIEAASLDPDSLISAILKAPVDLIWFGGIGTYVKSEGENNATVGDPANDALRVNGEELRAKVIGEGANLGCTQAGRIEFALGGGRINTDFIDNSAGVDCSDNEVNIKIALASAKRAGRLSEKARVALLADMTGAVGTHVLEDNRLQALALSIAEAGGPRAVPSHIRLIEMLEESGELDRRTEGLADSDVLTRRAADGSGLTRPELAVLLSSAKLALQGAIEASALPDDPGLTEDLLAYFPEAMRSRFRRDILGHRLRREIVATALANRIVNRMGIVHPFELAEEEGAGLAQVAAAFVAAERLFGLAKLWQAIETEAMPEAARILLFERTASALGDQIADLLRTGGGTLQPSRLVADLEPGVNALIGSTGKLIKGEARSQSERMRSEFARAGVGEGLAGEVAQLFDVDGAVGLARLASDGGLSPLVVTAAFTELGARLGLDWAQLAAARMSPSDPWERLLVNGLARDFQHMRIEFLRRIGKRKGDPVAAVAGWLEANRPAVAQFGAAIRRARAAVPVAPAMLAQLATQARNLLSR